MNIVENYQQVLDAIRNVKEGRKGYITNFYPDIVKVNNWINSGIFFISIINNTLFLFRQNNGFVNLYYCTTSLEILSQSLVTLKEENNESHLVVDLLGKMADVDLLSKVFKSSEFYEYVTLYRMSKIVNDKQKTALNLNLKAAKIKHADTIFRLLNEYFDPIAEQLPTIQEILTWISLSQISIYESEKDILGFVIYDLNGLTSYLRYWFVHPGHRNEKIGSVLLSKYFKCSEGTKRQLFWVIQSNDNAIKRYKHYGFEPENLVNLVMTNKNINYETESN